MKKTKFQRIMALMLALTLVLCGGIFSASADGIGKIGVLDVGQTYVAAFQHLVHGRVVCANPAAVPAVNELAPAIGGAGVLSARLVAESSQVLLQQVASRVVQEHDGAVHEKGQYGAVNRPFAFLPFGFNAAEHEDNREGG